jgi:hypothetical protein
MTRDPLLPPEEEPEPEREPTGTIEPTGPGPLVILGVVGLFIGWSVRGLAIRNGSPTPSISWLAISVTWFLVAVTAGTAYLTWRAVHRDRVLLSAQQGLTRLVLGKTMVRLAALALGGYLGAAISVLGVEGENADRLILHALLAALGAACGVASGLALEHACRVPPGPR